MPKGVNYPLYIPSSCQGAGKLISEGRTDDAIDLIERKAEEGDSGAAALLGYLQVRGALRNPNIEMIQDGLRLAANRGDPYAEFVLAITMLQLGESKLSSQWMQRSANHLFPPALAHLGGYMSGGIGFTEPCRESAMEMYKLALSRKHVPSLAFIATWYRKSANPVGRLFGMFLSAISFLAVAVQFQMRPFGVSTFFHVQDMRRPLFKSQKQGS